MDFDALPQPVRECSSVRKMTRTRQRASFRSGVCAWYQYARPRNKELHFQTKIVVPYRAPENRFVVDTDGSYIGLQDTYHIYFDNSAYSPYALAALLNSTPANFRYRALGGLGKLTGHGMYEYFSNQIARIPIPSFEENQEAYHRLEQLGDEAHLTVRETINIARAFHERAGQLIAEPVSFWPYHDPSGSYGGIVDWRRMSPA